MGRRRPSPPPPRRARARRGPWRRPTGFRGRGKAGQPESPGGQARARGDPGLWGEEAKAVGRTRFCRTSRPRLPGLCSGRGPPPAASRRRTEPRSAMRPRRRARFSRLQEEGGRPGWTQSRGGWGGARGGCLGSSEGGRAGGRLRAGAPAGFLSHGWSGLPAGQRTPSRERGRASAFGHPGPPRPARGPDAGLLGSRRGG